MSKVTSLAKFTLAFVALAAGISFIVGSLMGGGYSRSEYAKGSNNDPRSVLVRSILIESESPSVLPPELPAAGNAIDEQSFEALLQAARGPQDADKPAIRSPSVLVQHAETAIISIHVAGRVFEAKISPRVIETKHGEVIRVAIEIDRTDATSSGAERTVAFRTIYTTAPGGSMVMDLAGLGLPGSQAVLAIQTELIDPSPTPPN